jgi:hypothetical protein
MTENRITQIYILNIVCYIQNNHTIIDGTHLNINSNVNSAMGLSEKIGYRSQNDESAKRRASHSVSGLKGGEFMAGNADDDLLGEATIPRKVIRVDPGGLRELQGIRTNFGRTDGTGQLTL